MRTGQCFYKIYGHLNSMELEARNSNYRKAFTLGSLISQKMPIVGRLDSNNRLFVHIFCYSGSHINERNHLFAKPQLSPN